MAAPQQSNIYDMSQTVGTQQQI